MKTIVYELTVEDALRSANPGEPHKADIFAYNLESAKMYADGYIAARLEKFEGQLATLRRRGIIRAVKAIGAVAWAEADDAPKKAEKVKKPKDTPNPLLFGDMDVEEGEDE